MNNFHSLSTIELFKDLPSPLGEKVYAQARRHTITSGEFLFHQGEPANQFYVLLEGQMRLIQHTADGKDVTLAMFTDGDLIGLLVALADDVFPGSVEALSNSTLLSIPTSIMWEIMNAHGSVGSYVVKMLTHRLHEAHQRIRELSVEHVQQRIARALIRLVSKLGVKEEDGAIRLDVRLSRQDLAQLSGTTLETVSRTLTMWEAQQVIRTKREQVWITDPHQLIIIAEH